MIENLQSGTSKAIQVIAQGRNHIENGVQHENNAGGAFSAISAAVAKINEMNTHIASAAEEQSPVFSEINNRIESINNLSEGTASSGQKTVCAGTDLSIAAEKLDQLVGNFKVKN